MKLKISLESTNSEKQSGVINLNNFRHACNESISDLCVTEISLVKTHTLRLTSHIYQPELLDIDKLLPITQIGILDTFIVHPYRTFFLK